MERYDIFAETNKKVSIFGRNSKKVFIWSHVCMGLKILFYTIKCLIEMVRVAKITSPVV